MQSFVVRPQFRPCGQTYSGKQVRIDISDAAPKQRMMIDEMQNFCIGGDACMRQIRQRFQYGLALAQVAQSKFTDDKRMGQNRTNIE